MFPNLGEWLSTNCCAKIKKHGTLGQRYGFFFPGISLGVTHSLKFEKSVFFSEKVEKKNKCFFFPRNSLWAKNRFFWAVQSFLKRKIIWACFFFSLIFLFFYFSLEKFNFTHSLIWKSCFFFFRPPEEKRVFHSLSRFLPKNPQK